MAVSPLSLVLERARQVAAEDSNFFRRMTYYFELRVPASISLAGLDTFLVPLVIPPESYVLSEPFTVEATATQGGGLYVEENGIVQRTIRLEGTTGFKPRSFPRGFVATSVLSPEKTSFSRVLPNLVTTALSGQRHFQYLQDAVFRTYADLKRDPATAAGTYLFFHNPKDDEHWLVVPKDFTLTRERTLYRYSIELLVVDKAEAVDADFSEEKNIFDAMRDALSMVKRGLALLEGAYLDLVAIVSELRNFVKGIESILTQVAEVIRAVRDFVDGVEDLINVPYSFLKSIAENVEAALNGTWENEYIKILPPKTTHDLRELVDGLDAIGTHPEVFETDAQRQLRKVRDLQELQTALTASAFSEAKAGAPAATLEEVTAFGTAPTPGDAVASEGELGVGRAVIRYTSSQEVEVTAGDTLVSLAAKYLGDARLWQQIAVLNGLEPPFINDLASTPIDSDDPAFPSALGVGSKILVPSFSKPPQKQPVLPVLGVRIEEPAERHFLGTDFEFVQVAGREGAPVYDFAIDVDRGSVSLKQVSGVANMAQALRTRLQIEKGTDLLFKRLGLDRIIALNITPVDLETARFRFREAIAQDPRIASVRNLVFESGTESPDAVLIDATVELRGFTQALTVRSEIGK